MKSNVYAVMNAVRKYGHKLTNDEILELVVECNATHEERCTNEYEVSWLAGGRDLRAGDWAGELSWWRAGG